MEIEKGTVEADNTLRGLHFGFHNQRQLNLVPRSSRLTVH